MAEEQKITNPDTGHEIKLSSALTYDKDSKVYKLAQQMASGETSSEQKPKTNPRSHKPHVEHIGPNKNIIAKYGKYKLNAYPTENVNEADVQVNTEGDINSHAVLKWKDPKSGRMVMAYTKKFLERNAKIKWKRVEHIKPEFVQKVKDNSLKLLKSENPKVADAGACISLIANTGLRPGSRLGFGVTGNRGISTLGPDNISIDGSKIKINFIGKSYQENNAEVDNLELANYLKKRINQRPNEKFLFDLEKNELDDVFHKMTNHKIKIKDLRTYTATKMAADILEHSELPEQLPDNPKKLKKIIKGVLTNVFEKVSQKLNNTPAMAKSSYVHPKVIQQWLSQHNLEPSLAESKFISYSVKSFLMTEQQAQQMNSIDLEECDEYPLPSWWDNDNIDLVKKNVNESKIDNKTITDFIKSLEQSGMVAKNSYKNNKFIETVKAITSMSKPEFSDYIRKNPNQNVSMIYTEFNDWKQTYNKKPISEKINYEKEIFGGSGLEQYIKDAKKWWSDLSINEMKSLYKKYFSYGEYWQNNSSNILVIYIKEKFKPSDEEYKKVKDWWDKHKIKF